MIFELLYILIVYSLICCKLLLTKFKIYAFKIVIIYTKTKNQVNNIPTIFKTKTKDFKSVKGYITKINTRFLTTTPT